LNTAAIPSELLESELFGHEAGAFTGAQKRHVGRFEQADGGTLFLDEIGDMPLPLQTRLLRVLAEGEFFRVGGRELIRVDVRVIAATHQQLERLVAEGKFRADLLHRLDVVRLHLPPLRDRREDVPALAERFLAAAARKLGAPAKRFAKPALDRLRKYDWPGNVRELENAIERAVIIASGRQIELEDLPDSISKIALQERDQIKVERAKAASEGRTTTFQITVPSSMEEIERQAIEATLDYTEGDKSHAARAL
jgi:two-component system nitrogen regulation response regulator GlnG